MRQTSFQFPPISPMVKKLVIINLAIWFVGILILQKNILSEPYVFDWFGLVPSSVFYKFYIWQPVSYMFLHSLNIWHIVFNMLMLWWLGAELEAIWGRKFFLTYYLTCGIGAGVLYSVGVFIYSLVSGDVGPMEIPVVGASGAVFGLMVAYGILFAEKEMYFMFLFKMKAKHFVMLLGAFEVVSLLNSGFGSQVANLAHLTGALVGYLFLVYWSKNKQKPEKKSSGGRRRRLKLVVNNDDKPPKYWN